MEAHPLYFIAGAPGSGKTTVAEMLAGSRAGFVFFDIDWLLGPASRLAGRDIRFAPETWPPYGELWQGVLHAVLKNGLTPVLLTPADPSDFDHVPLPDRVTEIRWFLLDCGDDVRGERLRRRGWDEVRVREAWEDAALMRQRIPQRLDTTALRPDEVAAAVLSWLELDQQKG